MTGVYITGIICFTLIILAWISKDNNNDGGWRE